MECGCCSLRFNKKDDIDCVDANKYYMHCHLCKTNCQIKSKCTRNMYAYSIESNQSANVSVDAFATIGISHNCSQYKQKE